MRYAYVTTAATSTQIGHLSISIRAYMALSGTPLAMHTFQ